MAKTKINPVLGGENAASGPGVIFDLEEIVDVHEANNSEEVSANENSLQQQLLDQRLKAGSRLMSRIKKEVDEKVAQQYPVTESSTSTSLTVNALKINIPCLYLVSDVSTLNGAGFPLSDDNICLLPLHLQKKLRDIPVTIEQVGPSKRVLVKVGPCDLSAIGGHAVREKVLEAVITHALNRNNINKLYKDVAVSACVGIRGRVQMISDAFFGKRELHQGSHMGAYIKIAGEDKLTHWEPRKGPQPFFNDTLCALVTSVATSLFEYRVRNNTLNSSAQATKEVLKSPTLKQLFKDVLKRSKDVLTILYRGAIQMVNQFNQQARTTEGGQLPPNSGNHRR